MVKEERILKQFKDFEQPFEAVILIKSTVHFKINLYKFIRKCPASGRPTLSSHYFRSNFRLISSACK